MNAAAPSLSPPNAAASREPGRAPTRTVTNADSNACTTPAEPSRGHSTETFGGTSGGDLREIIEAYHAVTERLQHSHETLQSEVLRLREELVSADAQLQRSKRLAALGQMAAGIAHEVRNPLAAIGLYAEMIEQDARPLRETPSIGQTAAKITDAVRGLSGIVHDVLNFARALEPRPRALDLREMLRRAADAHQPVARQHDVDLAIGFTHDARVHLDPDLIHQALLNLLRNAVDALADQPQNTAKRIRLSGSLEPRDRTLTLRVADTGPGIDDDTIDRIFNPFFTTRSTGTGLGLAIVHRIVDAHAGSIAVHRDPHSGGAVFTLSLPQHAAPAQTV